MSKHISKEEIEARNSDRELALGLFPLLLIFTGLLFLGACGTSNSTSIKPFQGKIETTQTWGNRVVTCGYKPGTYRDDTYGGKVKCQF